MRTRHGRLVVAAAAAGLLAGCASTAVGAARVVVSASPTPAAPSATASSPGTPAAVAPSPLATRDPSPPAGPAWTPVFGSRALETAHEGPVALLWMDPARLRFRYVPGTQVPEGSPVAPSDRAPSTWTRTMLAAFDSGYKLRDHVGGYVYRGRTVAPLRPGLGAFTVSADGTLSVGVWGRDLAASSSTVVIRENLPPLVASGVLRATPHDPVRLWGKANGDASRVNRSALARLRDGSLVFEYGHGVTAYDMGRALVGLGAVDAVMLDMNRSWPTGFVYRPGSHGVDGRRIDPRIVRDPSTYLHPFKKDFVVVLAR